ncbi:MAG: hypothetical protein LH481_16265 [Burkholderiales bacterium]|nr:hypothetical protein [Burkholderiales bacterium]
MHWPIAFVQLFFTLGWTVYVIFLPGLLKVAGIDIAWLPCILIIDQLLFAAADFAKAGNWLTALFVWVICSSVLRVPPLVLLAKYATPQQPATMRSPIAAYLFGLGVAGARGCCVAVGCRLAWHDVCSAARTMVNATLKSNSYRLPECSTLAAWKTLSACKPRQC